MADFDVIKFAGSWVSENVHNVHGVEDPSTVVSTLKAKFLADAHAKGLNQQQIERELGDLDDYFDVAYMNVHDPDAGGFR